MSELEEVERPVTIGAKIAAKMKDVLNSNRVILDGLGLVVFEHLTNAYAVRTCLIEQFSRRIHLPMIPCGSLTRQYPYNIMPLRVIDWFVISAIMVAATLITYFFSPLGIVIGIFAFTYFVCRLYPEKPIPRNS